MLCHTHSSCAVKMIMNVIGIMMPANVRAYSTVACPDSDGRECAFTLGASERHANAWLEKNGIGGQIWNDRTNRIPIRNGHYDEIGGTAARSQVTSGNRAVALAELL